ncbi:MAG: hypothetical protein JXP34_22695 [Planctomycetes bacterium]|nr:hypothetical protein [Planctomycetota bacterium]
MSWKTVIHVHTEYSWDCSMPIARLRDACLRRRVDCVAVTDHDEIEGALRLRDLGGVRVIVGEEVSTRDGHVLGLFIERRIPPDLSAAETCDRIREQGGIVALPHPFATLCSKSLRRRVYSLIPRTDAIEIGNALNPFRWQCHRGRRLARSFGLPGFVGGDVHTPWAIDAAFQTMHPFAGPDAFLESLRAARFHLGWQPLVSLAVQGASDARRRLVEILARLRARRRAPSPEDPEVPPCFSERRVEDEWTPR